VKYTVDIPAIVYRDIAGISDYIAKDNAGAAKKVAGKIYNAIAGLENNPLAFTELKSRFDIESDLRFKPVLPYAYLVLYKVDGSIVKIYRVLDGRSDYLVALNLKEPQETYEEDN
jgi:plasmid stabilization system protein ParE